MLERYFGDPFFPFRELTRVPLFCLKVLRSAVRGDMKVSSCTTGKLGHVPLRQAKKWPKRSGMGKNSPVVQELMLFHAIFTHVWDWLCHLKNEIPCGHIGGTGTLSFWEGLLSTITGIFLSLLFIWLLCLFLLVLIFYPSFFVILIIVLIFFVLKLLDVYYYLVLLRFLVI